MATPLSDAFRAAPRPDVHTESSDATDSADDAELEARLVAVCETAEATWPELSVPRTLFVAYLRGRGVDPIAMVGEDGRVVDPVYIEAASELYLACGCNRGDPRAHAAFDDRYLAIVPRAVAHMQLDDATVDDVRQHVRQKLLMPAGDAAATPDDSDDGDEVITRLDDYAGKGKLGGLVQVVAVRAAISLLRKRKRDVPVPGDELHDLPSPAHDPALASLKDEYRSAFKVAFAGAIDDLEDRERVLLRLHVLRGVTLDRLAEMYDVHRSTITRWLAKARERVLSGTRQRLSRELQVDRAEFESMMRLIESNLDVSVSRVLATREPSA